jgi:hypothetical protein
MVLLMKTGSAVSIFVVNFYNEESGTSIVLLGDSNG